MYPGVSPDLVCQKEISRGSPYHLEAAAVTGWGEVCIQETLDPHGSLGYQRITDQRHLWYCKRKGRVGHLQALELRASELCAAEGASFLGPHLPARTEAHT